MFKNYFSIFIGILMFVGNAIASMTCPEISTIKKPEWVSSVWFHSNMGYAIITGKFDTEANWSFGIGPFIAITSDEVIVKFQQTLKNMTSPGVLIDANNGGFLSCHYETGDSNIVALATTRPVMPMNLIRHLNSGSQD